MTEYYVRGRRVSEAEFRKAAATNAEIMKGFNPNDTSACFELFGKCIPILAVKK